jgi:hypothetical protein
MNLIKIPVRGDAVIDKDKFKAPNGHHAKPMVAHGMSYVAE